MNFGFTEEQDLLRAEVRKFLDEQCPMARVRALMESDEGFCRRLWAEMAALGWLGLIIPEAYGGAELGWVDLVVLLEETGRSLYPSPLISTTLASAAILDAQSKTQCERFLPGIADGSCIGTVAILEQNDVTTPSSIALLGKREGGDFVLSGKKRFVCDAGSATLFVVAFRTGVGAEDLALAVVERDAGGVRAESHPTMDRTKRLGSVELENVRIGADALLGEPGRAWPAIQRVLDRGAVAVTGEMVGAAEAALALTPQYAKDRIQFDQPIGKYQGVKHPMAEMYVDAESFKSLLYYAAWTLDESPAEASAAASKAKAYASDAFARIGIDGVQLHGAVGYTDELDIQLYLKRAKWARPLYGDADYHYERVAALGGL
jgi:alkylation response protein AidB-like acyl-CoA dehydrogenase